MVLKVAAHRTAGLHLPENLLGDVAVNVEEAPVVELEPEIAVLVVIAHLFDQGGIHRLQFRFHRPSFEIAPPFFSALAAGADSFTLEAPGAAITSLAAGVSRGIGQPQSKK
jgi:hypothetical protein